MQPKKDTKPWFKQFWPWFLIVLPSTAVVASMFTIGLAVSNAPTITSKNIGKFARETTPSVIQKDAQ